MGLDAFDFAYRRVEATEVQRFLSRRARNDDGPSVAFKPVALGRTCVQLGCSVERPPALDLSREW